MEVITLLSVAVMPIVVRYATSLVKGVGVIAMSANRVAWVRALVAVLALAGALLTQMIGGPIVDEALVETALLALFNAVGATWLYFKTK